MYARTKKCDYANFEQSCTGDDQANFEYFLEKIQTILNYWYKVSNFSFLHKAMPKQESSQLRPAEWSLRQ